MDKKTLKIWTFVDYNTLPIHGAFTRHYNLGLAMTNLGHNITVFAGSHPHNTNLQLINDNKKFLLFQKEPFYWVFIKTLNYGKNKIKRIISMFYFYFNSKKAAKHFEKPDIIIGSSAHPLCALLAIKLGKKYKAKSVVEIRDLWPESIVALDLASKNNPIIKLLYVFEKYLYINADSIIFTFEGGYDYIKEKGLDNLIPKEKVNYINNGVNIKEFDENVKNNIFKDIDLDCDKFKVIYTGSIKYVNYVDVLIDAAKELINYKNIIFLIYGDGDSLDRLKKRCKVENINNVIFKGRVEKKYIPFILIKSNVNIICSNPTKEEKLLKYGISANKLFEYLAAGKPIINNTKMNYNFITEKKCGISKSLYNGKEFADAILEIYNLDKTSYNTMCDNARKTAYDFDFSILAKNLEKICYNIIE